ncbi:MAG: hypothetical protein ACI9C4_000227 [Paraglaciecola sp.]
MRQKIFSCVIALFTFTFLGCDNRNAQEYVFLAKLQYQDNQAQAALVDSKNAMMLELQYVKATKNSGLNCPFSEAKERPKAKYIRNKERIIFTTLIKSTHYRNDFDQRLDSTDHFYSGDKTIQDTVSLFTPLSTLKGAATTFHQDLNFSPLTGENLLLAGGYQAFSNGRFKEAGVLSIQLTHFGQEQIKSTRSNLIAGISTYRI